MILGIGIDQCDVRRMRRRLDGPTDGFVSSVFRPAEITYCMSKHLPEEHFAARFAAKEAFFKALGTGWRGGLKFSEIEVIPFVSGKFW